MLIDKSPENNINIALKLLSKITGKKKKVSKKGHTRITNITINIKI